MELKDLVTLYRRWIWLLIVGTILGLVSGFIASKIQTPIYEASTRILITRSRQEGSADMLSLSDQELVLTYQQLLKTRPVLHEVEARLETSIDPDYIKVEVVQNTQIIQIKVQDRNPQKAVDIANTLVQILIEQNETLYAGRYTAYEEGLNSQIADIQVQINNLQSQITQINEASVEKQLVMVNQQITQIQDQISTLESDIAKFPSLLSTLDRAKLAEKQTQLDQLRSLLYIYQQIQSNLTFIGRPVQGGSGFTDPQLTSLHATLDLYQQLYLNLLNNLTTIKLARVQTTPRVAQIEDAVIPQVPIRPIPLLYPALSGVIGLIIIAGTILLIDYFDDTIKSSQKIQEILGIPVIGEIANVGQTHKAGTSNSANQTSPSLLSAFGILRINLSRLIKQSSLKTILVTSAALGEGKTTIAANLAEAFARSGKKVVLLDGDLYRSQLHGRLKLNNEKGLTSILSDGLDWTEVAQKSGRMTVIPGGPPSSSSAVLLESDAMTELLEELEENSDVVIIDGPPLFIMDAQILASRAVGIVLVVRQGNTITAAARAMLNQLHFMEANVFGAVLNCVPHNQSYYFDERVEHLSGKRSELPDRLRARKKGGSQKEASKLNETRTPLQ